MWRWCAPVTGKRGFRAQPVARVGGTVSVPGDKSISHRALMLGALAHGDTHIAGFLDSADCRASLAALRALGVRIERPGTGRVIVHGAGFPDLRAA